MTQKRVFTDDELSAALDDVRAAVNETGETPERVSKSADLRDELDIILQRLQQAHKAAKKPVKTVAKKTAVRKGVTKRRTS